MATKKVPTITVERTSSADDVADTTTTPGLRTPRFGRFGEATAVYSPIERVNADQSFESYKPQPQPGDIGFGYINDRRSLQTVQHVEMPASPKSPLKSAMKLPGGGKAAENPLKSPTFAEETILSPTWREEKLLEKRETFTDKQQQEDLKVKIRVRMAKMILRWTNLSCSLIVLAMVATVLTIFRATVNLPPRNTLPAWAPNTPRWPQITLLCIACVSLAASIGIIFAYFRGGHRKAEKLTVYWSVFAVAFFIFSIVMWAVGAGLFQNSRNSSNGQDMWGWSCKKNTREKLFADDVNYSLLCRLQNWSLVCCIIEIVVEVITIIVYGIVFYRFWSKRKLRRTMAARDKARSQLYMSQMRSGANTPGLMSPTFNTAPLSPREGGYNPMFSPRFASGSKDATDAAERGEVEHEAASKPFTLQKAPAKSPKPQPLNFNSTAQASEPIHSPAAPGEHTFAAVPIPGAYATPASPTVQGFRS